MSYIVTQRTQEFGIRLALGAARADVVWSVLRHGALLIALGTAIGVAIGRRALARFHQPVVRSDAPGRRVRPGDPRSRHRGLLACFVPAVRATRVDPVIALRSS